MKSLTVLGFAVALAAATYGQVQVVELECSTFIKSEFHVATVEAEKECSNDPFIFMDPSYQVFPYLCTLGRLGFLQANDEKRSIAIQWDGLLEFYSSVGLGVQYEMCIVGIFPDAFVSSSGMEMVSDFVDCDYHELNVAFDKLEICIHKYLVKECTMEELIGLEINYEPEEYGTVGYPTILSAQFIKFLTYVDITVVDIRLVAGMKGIFIRDFEDAGITKASHLVALIAKYEYNRSAFVAYLSVTFNVSFDDANEMFYNIMDWCKAHDGECDAILEEEEEEDSSSEESLEESSSSGSKSSKSSEESSGSGSSSKSSKGSSGSGSSSKSSKGSSSSSDSSTDEDSEETKFLTSLTVSVQANFYKFVSTTTTIVGMKAKSVFGMKGIYVGRLRTIGKVETAIGLYKKIVSLDMDIDAFVAWCEPMKIVEVQAKIMFYSLTSWCEAHSTACAADIATEEE